MLIACYHLYARTTLTSSSNSVFKPRWLKWVAHNSGPYTHINMTWQSYLALVLSS